MKLYFELTLMYVYYYCRRLHLALLPFEMAMIGDAIMLYSNITGNNIRNFYGKPYCKMIMRAVKIVFAGLPVSGIESRIFRI
jgi:hypothetical protein